MILILILALLVVFGAATFVLFYTSFYYQRRAKILNKIPLLDVVEIEEAGTARIKGRVTLLEQSLRSPLSNTKCAYYRFIVEEEKPKEKVASNFARRRGAEDDDADMEWETVLDEVKTVPFAVEDDTGMAEILAHEIDAEIQSRNRNVTGSLKSCSASQEKSLLERYPGKKFLFTKKMRFTEITIEPKDEIAVTGEVEFRKGRDPRFVPSEDTPIQVNDKTEEGKIRETLSKAKTNKILAYGSSVATVAVAVWLIVYLASPSKRKSSDVVDSSSDTPTRPTNTNTNNNPNPFQPPADVKPKDQPPKKKIDPIDDIPVVAPPMKDFPPVVVPKKEPPKNDVDALIDEIAEKGAANDIHGMKTLLDRIAKNVPKNHPRRADMFKALNAASKTDNVFIKGDCCGAAIPYAGKAEVPELFEMLKEKRNVFAEDAIFNQLAAIKDPACAEEIATYLKAGGFNTGRAAKVLRAIGAPAEKFVLPYAILKPGAGPQDDIFIRKEAINILGDIGTQASVPALQNMQKEFFVKQEATQAIQKILKRNP